MEKKVIAGVAGAILSLGVASSAYASPLANINFTTTNAYYSGSDLTVEGVIANVGNATAHGIPNAQLSLKDQYGATDGADFSADPRLANLTLAPGSTASWSFTIHNASHLDLSTYYAHFNAGAYYDQSSQYESGIHVFVDNQAVQSDVNPVIVNGRTLVPMRAIFQQIGATVSWDESTQTVTVVKGSTTVKHKVGTNVMTVNGVNKTLDVPSSTVNYRTMIPLRAFSEAFGGTVQYGTPSDGSYMTIAVTL